MYTAYHSDVVTLRADCMQTQYIGRAESGSGVATLYQLIKVKLTDIFRTKSIEMYQNCVNWLMSPEADGV